MSKSTAGSGFTYNPHSIPNRVRRFFRYWYRRAKHLCVACGQIPEMRLPDPYGLRLVDVNPKVARTYQHWCRYCTKRHMFAQHYGMGHKQWGSLN